MLSMKTRSQTHEVTAPKSLCVEATTTVRQLARALEEIETPGAPVINGEGALIGVVSRTDLLRACSDPAPDCAPAYLFQVLPEQEGEEGDETVDAAPKPLVGGADLRRRTPVTVTPDTPLATIARLMHEGRIRRLLVVEAGMLPVVIVTTLDLLGVLSP